MTKYFHSPEPWKRGTDGLIYDANNDFVTDTCGTSLPEGVENQKRIVACVNAMQGIDDPQAFRNKSQ
jgi:hypothetical protein